MKTNRETMNSHPHLHQLDCRAGFSLIELMVTLGVIAIIAAVSAPAIMTMAPSMQLRSATRDLYSNLQQAKLQAVKENRSISVRFDTAAGNYYIDANNDSAFTAGEKRVILENYDDDDDTVSNADKGVEYFAPPEANRNWNDTDIAQAAFITFNSRGTAGAATIYLVNHPVNNEYATLKSGNETVNGFGVTVRSSGSIKTYKFTGTLPMTQGHWSK